MVYIYINDLFYKLRTEHRSIGCIAGTNYTQFFWLDGFHVVYMYICVINMHNMINVSFAVKS